MYTEAGSRYQQTIEVKSDHAPAGSLTSTLLESLCHQLLALKIVPLRMTLVEVNHDNGDESVMSHLSQLTL